MHSIVLRSNHLICFFIVQFVFYSFDENGTKIGHRYNFVHWNPYLDTIAAIVVTVYFFMFLLSNINSFLKHCTFISDIKNNRVTRSVPSDGCCVPYPLWKEWKNNWIVFDIYYYRYSQLHFLLFVRTVWIVITKTTKHC